MAKHPQNPVKLSPAERTYAKQLRSLAKHVGEIIGGFPPGDPETVPTITDLLRRYAEALTPWASQSAARMLEEVNQRDLKAWRTVGQDLTVGMRKQIIEAPVGATMQELLAKQVTLIKSIPLDAAKRVHELTIKGLEDGTRAKEIAAEIMRSGEVSSSRAMLIARTEVARAATTFTQARAMHVGSGGYTWQTSRDGDVRPSHKAMQGRVIRWDDPPTLDGMTGHAGSLPNCRCWPKVILPE